MATFNYHRVIGLEELTKEDLSGEELDNLKKGESILSCNTFKYSELTDDQLEEILQYSGLEIVLEIRPDFIQKVHPELIS